MILLFLNFTQILFAQLKIQDDYFHKREVPFRIIEITERKIHIGSNYFLVTKERYQMNKKTLSNAVINVYRVSVGVYAWSQEKKPFDKFNLLRLLNQKTKKEFIRRVRIKQCDLLLNNYSATF